MTRVSGCAHPVDDAVQVPVFGVWVSSGDVATDHAAVFLMGSVVGAVEHGLVRDSMQSQSSVSPRESP